MGAAVKTTTSAANIDLAKSLGADIVIDYKKDDFELTLKDYDAVLNSQDAKTLEKSFHILKPVENLFLFLVRLMLTLQKKLAYPGL